MPASYPVSATAGLNGISPEADKTEVDDSLVAQARRVALGLNSLVVAFAIAALAGHAADVRFLSSFGFAGHSVAPLTAGMLGLTAIGILTSRRLRYAAWADTLFRGCAGLGLGASAFTLSAHIAGWATYGVPVAAALSAVLINAGLLLRNTSLRPAAAQGLVVLAGVLGTLGLVSSFFGEDAARGLGLYAPMEIPTSVGVLLLALAFLCSDAREGIMRTVMDPGQGGMLIRHLLPAVFLVPVLLVWLSWQGARANWYSAAFAMAVFVVLLMSILVAGVWAGGRIWSDAETRRLAAELLRQQSEDRLRRAVADAPVPIVIHDETGLIQHVSRGWTELSGYTLEDTPTMAAWFACAQPTHATDARAYLGQLASAAGTHHGGESAIRTRTGATRHWEFSTTPVGALAGGRVFVTTALDVTERKAAEDELRRMNEDLETRIASRTAELTRANDALRRQSDQVQEQAALLDLVRDGILVRDLYGTIIYWSAGAAEMYGFSARDALGASSHKLLGSTYPRPIAEIEKQIIDSGYWEGEVIHTTRNGTRLAVESRCTLTRSDRGVPQGFLEVNRDITARRRAQDSLRDSEMRFRALAETAHEGIVTVDDQGLIQYWNPGAARMFRRTADDVTGQPLSLFIPDRLRPTHGSGLQRYLASREPIVSGKTLELVGVRGDGTEFPVEVSLSSWHSTRGLFFTGILRDITDRKNVEHELEAKAEELARSNQELEQFAYVASHDLQEPLRMVANYTQLLGRRYRNQLDGDAHEFIDYAVDGAKRMQALIHDLLQYARVGTRGKEFRTIAGERVVQEALSNLASTIEETQATIVVGPLPALVADEFQIVQVFQNLIGNAIKFRRSEQAPTVHITAVRQADAWLFAVADNGIGIGSRYFERIFQMFQRLHGRGEYPGTGIGLALCKKIVERHGGRITVTSEPGHGTTFSFTIPDTARASRLEASA